MVVPQPHSEEENQHEEQRLGKPAAAQLPIGIVGVTFDKPTFGSFRVVGKYAIAELA